MSQQKTSPDSSPLSNDPIVCFLDVETTGTQYWKHAVVQISGVIINSKRDQDQWFDLNAAPFDDDEIDPEALELTGFTEEAIYKMPRPEDTYQALVNMFSGHVDRYNKLQKMVMMGWNVRFDADFLRRFWMKADKKEGKFFGSWFFTPYIDVMSLAGTALMADRYKLGDFKLGTVADFLGIEVDSEALHSSLYDVELTLQVYNKVRVMLGGKA